MLRYPKRFTKEKKSSILLEHFQGGVSISELSRKYQVSAHIVLINEFINIPSYAAYFNEGF